MLPLNRWIGEKKNFRVQSPVFRFSKTNLSNGSSFVTNLEGSNRYRKYSPFNFLQVSNQTDQTLLIVTDTMVKSIYSGTILSFDEETLPAYRYVEIRNASGSNATGEIEVICQKVRSYKQVIKERLG